ncbi:MAG: LuxR family transcriptional regulator [Alphaproteobacteria bacterium]|nr:MAG: LuxR family transcriptional regulator [Alphaproteobacteria bacterium]
MLCDFTLRITSAPDVAAVWDIHCAAMAQFGFDRLIYGSTRRRAAASRGDIDDAVFLSNHDQDYFDAFIRQRRFLRAPIMRWARENYGACSWKRLWNDPRYVQAHDREILAFNHSKDVKAGYSIRFPDHGGGGFGLIALAARADLSADEVEEIWAHDGDLIEAMNHIAHLKIISLPRPDIPPARLTPRQREVLQWVADGKTNKDVAVLLGVSPTTVEKHLRLVREKLAVETTLQAVLKAAFQNLIDP